MTLSSLIVQQPSPAAKRLVLLLHGVGSVPQAMLGVAQWFATRDPDACVVSIASPYPADISNGLQWFSVRGVTEENRQARVDAVMQDFLATVGHWQGVAGVDASNTLLAGFSQGAIMALEATKLPQAPASTIVAFGGRYATLPSQRPEAVIHLLHGSADPVMPVAQAQAAFSRLQDQGAQATLDIAPGVGHEPHPALLAKLAAQLPAL